jgi:hypothetical protein
MDVIFRLRRRLFQRGIPPLMAACRCYYGCLYVYDLPLRLTSTTFIAACLFGLPLWPASMACLYGLPLRPALTACLFCLPLPSASTPTVCLYGLPSSCYLHHHHPHRPFPVQAEHLFFSFICDS